VFPPNWLILRLPCGKMCFMVGLALTIPAFFEATVARRGDERALGFIKAGELHWRTWREVAADAKRLAAEIRAAGIEPGDRVAQVSENRYEWIITDLAVHLAGAVHVPIQVTLSGRQIAEQIVDSGTQLVFASNAELLTKFVGELPGNVPVVLHGDQANGRQTTLLDKPMAPAIPQAPNRRLSTPDGLATILYTSGTTGRPRGVMLSQGNLASNAKATCDAYGGNSAMRRLGILPLSHIYARTCDLYTWVYAGSQLVLSESRETFQRDCQLARPTAINVVPYLYQRIADQVRTSGVADESAEVRAVFGGRVEHLFSGGAPLAPEVEDWYAERGVVILCGYGLSESSPVISMSVPGAARRGAVGRVLPGVDVRIAEDGEILARGPNIMMGYWRDEEATAETIRDGWLHTGDLGGLDADGFLSILGRKKELIVLSTGKKAVPTRVENLLTASPLIEQAVVFGEGQSALVALIVPDFARLQSKAVAGWNRASGEPVNNHPEVRELFAEEISRELSAAAREEQVRYFTLLDRPFSIDRGEMTAKLSLRRTVIAEHFTAELKAMTSSSRKVPESSQLPR
ncbi:MAG: AMP-dependent synthetase/ligase, partial [Planctomycetes bacterium]|nr:AMP-dependent synthetase/ligase [Planctomycetota bacterium]